MCQAMSLQARAGDAHGRGSRVMEEGRSVRLNPAGCVVFNGWAPGSPGKQRGTVVVPGMCHCSLARVRAPGPVVGTEGASHQSMRCDLTILTRSPGTWVCPAGHQALERGAGDGAAVHPAMLKALGTQQKTTQDPSLSI